MQVKALERRLQVSLMDCKSMMEKALSGMSYKLDADFAHEPVGDLQEQLGTDKG